jgi:intracellular septation protein
MMASASPKPKSGWINLVIDYGPVLVFFLVYRHFTPADRENAVGEVLAVIKGTTSFVVAAIVALIVSRWKFGHISPMLWLSTALIAFFGGMTVLLHDAFWIQVKPTVIYLIFGTALLAGVWRGRALLRILLETAFEGLDDAGWMILSRNWGWFFLFLAALNEMLRQIYNFENHNFGTWLALKLWLFLPLSFIFTFAHMPMLLRHGLAQEAEDEVASNPPHE